MLLFEFDAWWGGKEVFEQIYWVLALPSSLIFTVMLVLTFLGGDLEDGGGADSDIDADDGIGFQFFTLKNLVGFFTVFAWTGLACIDSGLGIPTTVIISVICGMVIMAIMASLFYMMGKLVGSGTLNIDNAIGGVGEVYLPIGKNKSGFGKVQISIQGGLRTLQAMTEDDEDLPVGTIVDVQKVINNQILVVVKSSK